MATRLVDLFVGGDINQHIYRTDQAPRSIVQRRRIGPKGDTRSVGPLGDSLTTPDRTVFLQRPGHRALVMRHPPTIGPIETPRYAPLVAADFGPTTRELHCGLIEEGDPTGGVGRINRRRQRVEQIAKMPTPVAELDLRPHLPLPTPPDSVLNGAAVRRCRPPSGCRAHCDARVSVNSFAHLGADRPSSIADPASGSQRYLNGRPAVLVPRVRAHDEMGARNKENISS